MLIKVYELDEGVVHLRTGVTEYMVSTFQSSHLYLYLISTNLERKKKNRAQLLAACQANYGTKRYMSDVEGRSQNS